ncbi:MAG: CoA transferase [Moraxellaceae bacterium]|nr:MAG: CoA transferase [Moraxellaceae bacterium]
MEHSAALEGITVLDLGQIYNAPYAGFLMANAGARVIKVESLIGETLRGRGETSSAAYAFTMLNQNKESITIDLKNQQGKALFYDLVKKADVVLENFSPGVMKKLGLSSETLREINPRLIYAAGSGYGQSGPQRDYLAMDITVQAMSGIISTTGEEGQDPLKSGVALCDFLGGIHLYAAITTALVRRERTGQGATVDVAMQDSVFPVLATVLGAYYYGDKKVPPRTGNKHPALTVAPYNVYQAKDGHVSIICIRDGHWRAMLKAMDRTDLLEDDGFKKMADRAKAMDAVDDLVSSWTASRSKQEILEVLQENSVPCAIVRNVEEVLNDEQMHYRGMLRHVEHPQMGDIILPASPLYFEGEERLEQTLPPKLGEQNDLVLGDLLGLDKETIEKLRINGVIEKQ